MSFLVKIGLLRSKLNELFPGKFDFTYSNLSFSERFFKEIKDNPSSKLNNNFFFWNKVESWYFPGVDMSSINDTEAQEKYISLKNSYKLTKFFHLLSIILFILNFISILFLLN
ncbi:MAG: hypothetical protein WCK60_00090 [Candidatus Nomurabacteria bacterium]